MVLTFCFISVLNDDRNYTEFPKLKDEIAASQNKHQSSQRSLVCEPLRIETYRYNGEHPAERLCKMCDTNSIEDETHCLINRAFYRNIRT